jgi:hypothetical protein
MTALSESFVAAERSYVACKAGRAASAAALADNGPRGVFARGTHLGSDKARLCAFRDYVFTSIRPIAQCIAGQSITVAKRNPGPKRRRDASEDVVAVDASHPLQQLVDDPNDVLLGWSNLYSTVLHLELCGRSFWWLADSDRPDREFDIWALPPHWVAPSDSIRTSYWVHPHGSDVNKGSSG